MKLDKMMIVRTIVLAFALINQTLVLSGFSPLPFDDKEVENAVTITFTIFASVLTWWKNNAITRDARRVEEMAKQKGLK